MPRIPTILAAFAVLAPGAALAADPSPGRYPMQLPEYRPPAAGAPQYANGCTVSFAKYRGGRGPRVTRQGPEAIPDMDLVRYANGETLDADVLSVHTGPGAWLELFDRRNYRRTLYRIGPNSGADLRRDDSDSYRIYCAPPPHWQ